MRILIAGCGYVGGYLAAALKKEGHEVWALRRDKAALAPLEAIGVVTVAADLNDLKSLTALPSFEAIVLMQSPRTDTDSYESTYYAGTKNLLRAIGRAEIKKFIFISSTGVYSTNDGSWVNENTNPRAEIYKIHPDDGTEWLLRTEDAVLQSGVPAVVLRLGGIYGPGRNRLQALREGKIKPVLSDKFVNRIYVTDIVAAIQLLLKKGKNREIYIGCDDYPSTQKEFYEWLLPRMGLTQLLTQPTEPSKDEMNKRCSNKKIKELGLELSCPTFKEGYTEILSEES